MYVADGGVAAFESERHQHRKARHQHLLAASGPRTPHKQIDR